MKSKIDAFKKDIVNQYLTTDKTVYDLARECNCWPGSISIVLKNAGVTQNKIGKYKRMNKLSAATKAQHSRELIQAGDHNTLSEACVRKHMKRILIEDTGHICSICKNTNWCGQLIPLVCDHIDGNSSNYKPENFRLVCRNCDAQLPTFGSKNRGNGRLSEKLRYHANKRRVG